MAASKQMNADQLVATMEGWYAKLPSLPKNVQDVLAKVAPWLALIFGVLGVLGILSGVVAFLGLGLFGASMMPYGGVAVAGASAFGIVILLLDLVPTVLNLMAFSGLKAGKMVGWNYLLYALVASVVISVLAGGVSSVLGAVIEAAIGLYFLFQIKSYYK